MSKLTEYLNAQKAFNQRVSDGLDGISADVLQLKAKIDKLNSTPGTLSPEDQALLDELQTEAADLATRVEALDGETVPEAPTAATGEGTDTPPANPPA